MTDAQQLFDYARNQFNEIASDVERHFDQVAGTLKERFAGARPLAPPPRPRLPPPTTWQLAQRWMLRNRALTAAIVAFFVTGSVAALVHVKSGSRRRRRARKSPNGARIDVVVVAGAVANPLMSALYLDLERRGFVVYVVTPTAEDEHYIRSQQRADLIPLPLDLTDPFMASNQVAHFENIFAKKHYAFESAEPHNLNFRGLILVPDTQSPPAKVEDISVEDWSDALNAKVLNTIAVTRILLPTIVEYKAKVMMLAPSITPTFKPPMHALESTVFGALQNFTTCLASELKRDRISLTEFRLGNFEIPAVAARQRREGAPKPLVRPTPIRKLHEAVFNQLVARSPSRIAYVGRGAYTYDLIGSVTPGFLLRWLMGMQVPNSDHFMRKYGSGKKLGRQISDEDMPGSAGSLTWEKIDEDA